ncbi:MAG: hypothetical protein ACM31D_05085 [Bacteroidota bacterium]
MLSEEDIYKRVKPCFRTLVAARIDKHRFVTFEIRQTEYLDSNQAFFRMEARPLYETWRLPMEPDRWRVDLARYGNGVYEFRELQDAVQILVDLKHRTAKFGPKGHIRMRIRGVGLGSYLMSRGIEWLAERYPEFEVRRGMLSSADTPTDAERDQRNRFYAKHNFDFDWSSDPGMRDGSFFKEQAADLTPSENKLTETHLDQLVADYAKAVNRCADLERTTAAQKKALQDRDRVRLMLMRWATGLAAVVIVMIAVPSLPAFLHELVANLLAAR